jgi:predicted permease
MALVFDGKPDVRILAATMAFAALSTLIAGLAPAWKVTRPHVLPDLKERPADTGCGRRFGMRNLLVVGQIALSLALLTAAGLFMRAAVKAGAADPGIPLAGGAVVNVSPSLAGYDEARGRAAILRILQHVRSLPGVASASVASLVPFGDIREGRLIQKAGTPRAAPGERDPGVDAGYMIVGADYFGTLRIPVLRGRSFTPAEEGSAGRGGVAVIDEPLARHLFGEEDPLGRQVQIANDERTVKDPFEIVGVVGGIRDQLFDKAPRPHLYIPFGSTYRGDMHVHLRMAAPGAEAGLLETLRREVRTADAGIPVVSLKTLEQHRNASLLLWVVNAGAGLFSAFGAIALLLAAIGVYGVRSYVVSRRTREIGIRMALGATGADVIWLVLRESLVFTAVGVAIGLVLSWAVAKALAQLLYDVSPLDPLVFAVAPVVLLIAALLAAYVPARRATRIQPLSALRAD